MKKLMTLVVIGLVLLSSCVKGVDGIEPEPTPTPTESTDDIKANVENVFGVTFDSNLPDGRNKNNLSKVMALGYTDDNAYRVTTGTAPIIISPVYKCDGSPNWGGEVYNSSVSKIERLATMT